MRPYPQHFGSAFRAALILAGNTSPVINGFTALGTNALSTTAHRVFACMFNHGLSPGSGLDKCSVIQSVESAVGSIGATTKWWPLIACSI